MDAIFITLMPTEMQKCINNRLSVMLAVMPEALRKMALKSLADKTPQLINGTPPHAMTLPMLCAGVDRTVEDFYMLSEAHDRLSDINALNEAIKEGHRQLEKLIGTSKGEYLNHAGLLTGARLAFEKDALTRRKEYLESEVKASGGKVKETSMHPENASYEQLVSNAFFSEEDCVQTQLVYTQLALRRLEDIMTVSQKLKTDCAAHAVALNGSMGGEGSLF